MANTNQIPEGYKMDAQGNLRALENIKPLDLIKDELVLKLTEEAKELSLALTEFKAKAVKSVYDLMSLAAQEYDVKLGGKKGNISIASFDGKQKVLLAQSEQIVFDEKINLAKTLIDECLLDWSNGANRNLKAVIDKAFDVSKQGKLRKENILGLRQIEINDDKWKRAMDLIAESIQIASTREYIRFYQTQNEEEELIRLDISSI